MNGAIIPADITDSGTTNVSGVTWTRRGNVVVVSVYGPQGVSGQFANVTGLPTPYNAYVLVTTNDGYLQYDNGAWRLGYKTANALYMSLTYTV